MPSIRPTALSAPLFAAFALAAVAGRASADPVDELKVQVDALQKKVTQLEKSPAGDVVTGGATKGSFKLPGSDTSVTIGGYVKLDAVFSSRSAGVGSTGDLELEPSSIPVGPAAGANEGRQLKLGARQSRLFFKTSTPTSYGELATHLEYDLYGAAGNESVSNSHGLRVRHAFGQLGPFLAGQTWTTLSDPAAYPETVDFGGPVGVIFARQPQVRWTQPFAGGTWSVALENPETVAALRNGTTFRADDDRAPDIAANVRFETPIGHYSLAAMVRQVRVDAAAPDPALRDHKWGGVVGANAVVPFGRDDFRASAYVGNAIGRYSTGFFNDAVIGTGPRLQLPTQWVAFGAYRHLWTPTLRSNLVVSGMKSANPVDTGGAIHRAAQSLHLNLMWSPVPQTNFGIEYIAARRQVQSGDAGTLNRVQASAQYLF